MSERIAALLHPVGAFLRWWITELEGMVPERIRRLLAGSREALVLLLAGDELTLSHEAGGKARLLGRVPLAGLAGLAADEGLGAHLLDRTMRARLAQKRLSVRLRLPSDQALRTRISLPGAAEENLREVVEFELDRRTPFSAHSVHVAHRVVGRDPATGQMDVELIVVPRPVLAEALAIVAHLGFPADAADVAGETDDEPCSGNLLPETASRHRPSVMLLARTAATAVGVIAAILFYLPIWEAQGSRARLERDVEQAKAVAEQAARAKAEIARLSDGERFLLERKRGTPSASEMLFELTRVLPDDTWLVQLNLNASEVQLGGFSGSASGLLQVMGHSSLLKEPKFRSAVTLDPTVGRERFEIAASMPQRSAP